MKLRLLLSAAAVLSLLFTAGCQNVSTDLHAVTEQAISQNVYLGMSRDEVIQKYGDSIFLQARTAAADEELLVYVFQDIDAAHLHNIVSFVNNYSGITRKNLFLLFDQQNRVKDFKTDGFYSVEAYGYYSYRAYMHPLTEEQLNMTRPLTLEEGQASYLKYLEEVKGRDPSTFDKYDLEGNRETLMEYAFYVKEDAEAFAGPLKNIVANDKAFYDPQSQVQ